MDDERLLGRYEQMNILNLLADSESGSELDE